MHRLFLAIPLPDSIVTEVTALCDGIRPACGHVRWTTEENLHVTVLFLGEVGDDERERLVPRFADACRNALSFELTVTGLVVGPPRRTPTMLWLDFKPSVGFAALVTAVREAAQNIRDLEQAHGKPLPHVTLARFRDGVPVVCRKNAESIEYNRTFAVDRCVLFESCLSSAGPTYIALRTFGIGAK